MCNLYSITTDQATILALLHVMNRTSATCRRCRVSELFHAETTAEAADLDQRRPSTTSII
jgi:predicted nucleic-acid-binding Zn-ribbon protein